MKRHIEDGREKEPRTSVGGERSERRVYYGARAYSKPTVVL